MNKESTLVRRTAHLLQADPDRVILRFFLPGQEIAAHGIPHADPVIRRVLKMSDDEVAQTFNTIIARYITRHDDHDLFTAFADHFGHVAHHIPKNVEVSKERRDLIGAYFTREFAVEGAALFNPSVVAHPDQTALADGELRFIMSVRSLGEGHISSIEFRTGVLTPPYDVRLDDPGERLIAGRTSPATLTREYLRDFFAGHASEVAVEQLLNLLPTQFDVSRLDVIMTAVERDELTNDGAKAIINQIRRIAYNNYWLNFPSDHLLSERVIYPSGTDESQGMEDARFTRFVDDDGHVTYYGMYTAFDGSRLNQYLLETTNFQTFDITKLLGLAARNKGMALFPRRIKGQFAALSRWDNENISVALSSDIKKWDTSLELPIPRQPWEFVKLGNCGSPIETPEGWLVITHGVGAMREYSIGVVLLDLDDPTKIIGALNQPLMTPAENERNGYSPNVLYSCGALLHQQTLLLPYGCSDHTIRIALVDLPGLMDQLRASV